MLGRPTGRPPRGASKMRPFTVLVPDEVIEALEADFGDVGRTGLIRTALFHYFLNTSREEPDGDQRDRHERAVVALIQVSDPSGVSLSDAIAVAAAASDSADHMLGIRRDQRGPAGEMIATRSYRMDPDEVDAREAIMQTTS